MIKKEVGSTFLRALRTHTETMLLMFDRCGKYGRAQGGSVSIDKEHVFGSKNKKHRTARSSKISLPPKQTPPAGKGQSRF